MSLQEWFLIRIYFRLFAADYLFVLLIHDSSMQLIGHFYAYDYRADGDNVLIC